MEFKEKTYFEVYLDNILITSGIGENLKFSGDYTMHYIPAGYGSDIKGSNLMWKQTIPFCTINYISSSIEKEIEEGLDNNKNIMLLALNKELIIK